MTYEEKWQELQNIIDDIRATATLASADMGQDDWRRTIEDFERIVQHATKGIATAAQSAD